MQLCTAAYAVARFRRWVVTIVSGSTLISECDLSIRTKKLFENAGLKTVDDIFENRISDLMKYRGFGKRSLIELRGFLIRHNLSFYND